MKIITPAAYAVLFSITASFSHTVEFDILAGFFLFYAIVLVLSNGIRDVMDKRTKLFEATAYLADKIAVDKMPIERMRMLGFFVPGIDVNVEGIEFVSYIRGTDIPLDFFERFLRGSDAKQVWPLRNLKAKAEIELWHETVNYLARWGKIYKDAAGSHSHRWATDTTQAQLRQAFFPANLVNMSDWD